MVWALLILLSVAVAAGVLWAWYRGHTVQELVRRPPDEINLPEFVTILSYLHHELIKHRLPLVRTVAGRDLKDVQPADVEILKQAVTGRTDRPSVTSELEGYLSGLRRAAGAVPMNFWRDRLVRRVRRTCRMIQDVADGLGDRNHLTAAEHRRLRRADRELDAWFRPRLQALRNTVLLLPLSRETFQEQARRARQELGLPDAEIELPPLEEPIQLKMLRPDFDLVLRNLIRNGLSAANQAGNPRVAIELATRLELTGEETVMLRIHDTDPTILSKEQLYGGQLGRGLNIVTTTLRRYDGAISCKKSKLPGYAKYLELRLRRALAEDVGGELLDEADPWSRVLPVSVGLGLAACGAVAALGLGGVLPDPLGALGEGPAVVEADAGVEPPPGLSAEERGALARASRAADTRVVKAIDLSLREATAAVPGLRDVRVPAPADVEVDPRRCLEPARYADEQRLAVECRFVSSTTYFLEPPLLLLHPSPRKNLDLTRLQLAVDERVEAGSAVTLASERCMNVAVIAPREKLSGNFLRYATPEQREPRPTARLAIEYSECLKVGRYPVLARITLTHPARPKELLHVDVNVRLRNEDARTAYAKISNSDALLEDRATRAALVQIIARYVARKLEYSFSAGVMPDSSQQDYSAAIYSGWVRPGIHDAIVGRIVGARRKEQPSAEFCDLYEEIYGGYSRMRELNPRIVYAELYRSEYYTHQARLWVLGDLKSAIDALWSFQRSRARETDFVQGARFYLALMLALGDPPRSPQGLTGAINPEPDPADPVHRATRVLLDLKRDADKPPARGPDFSYDTIKLLGVHQLLDEDVDDPLGSAVSVNDALCAFYEARPRWVEVMAEGDIRRLFAHCPRYVPPLTSSSIFNEDRDAGTPDASERPLPVITEPVRRTMEYIERAQGIFGAPWSCNGASKREKKQP